VAQPEQKLVDTILDRIRAAIDELPKGYFLDTREAFTLANGVIEEDIAKRGLVMTPAEVRRHSRVIQYAAYHPARRLVASQLRGLTLQDLIATAESAAVRFLGKHELAIVPKPTKAFSGYCEPHDAWNLLSNIYDAERKAREEDPAKLSGKDLRLLADMKKCQQLLSMVHEKEVLPGDIVGKPFDGSIREQQWLYERAMSD
jgi:hypothetical protein